MIDHDIILPSKPKIINEDERRGIYEIDGLYPGYGQTLGNSLRRIILSSLPGAAITSLKIEGVLHEFSTMSGVKEDAVMLILNLKKIKFHLTGEEPQIAKLKIRGAKTITAGDLEVPGQLEVTNSEEYLATTTGKDSELNLEIKVEKGLGYITKEVLQKDKGEIGTIFLDASFTPIRRVSYEVENMRVGDRTDYNRLRLIIETDASLSPHAALERSIEIMINQLKAIVGFKEDFVEAASPASATDSLTAKTQEDDGEDKVERVKKETDFLKTRIEDLGFSPRIMKVMAEEGIRTAGGLARKRELDLREMDGLGDKAIEEIKLVLTQNGVTLKE